MSTITAILDPDADGALHLPVPEELRHGNVRVPVRSQLQRDDSPVHRVRYEHTHP